MSLHRCFFSLVCFLVLASANAEDVAKFISAKEVFAMAPRTGTLTKKTAYAGSFKTEDGKQFVLGDNAGGQEVWHFVGTLKEGQSYKFPEAFVNYIKSPSFEDAKQIVAMTPRAATLATRTPCSAYFNSPDGKGFHLGGPGSGAEVSQFLWSLKVGPAYKFPDVFLAYRAAPTYSTAKGIAAMAPRTGSLTGMFNDFCYFSTADGKGFVIGCRDEDAAREKEVDQFLRTLEEDATYKFPDTFLEYQKRNKKQ